MQWKFKFASAEQGQSIGTIAVLTVWTAHPALLSCRDWSALIEANFPDRGLTFPFRQLYSQSLNMVRHVHGAPSASVSKFLVHASNVVQCSLSQDACVSSFQATLAYRPDWT